MQESETNLTRIRRAAARGARSVTRSRHLEADAIACAIEKWEDATMQGTHVQDWEAWAFRIAANAVRRVGARLRRAPATSTPGDEAGFADAALAAFDAQDVSEPPHNGDKAVASCRRLLRAHLAQRKYLLRGRQLEVLHKMAEPGMSFHRAAKELGMPRFNVRRTFGSAMRRLLRAQK